MFHLCSIVTVKNVPPGPDDKMILHSFTLQTASLANPQNSNHRSYETTLVLISEKPGALLVADSASNVSAKP